MKITIDLLLLLKIYLLGSLVSMLILTFSKGLFRNKRNYLGAFLISWIGLVIPYDFLRTKLLNFMVDKIDLYIYSVIESFLYFKFRKRHILKTYFRHKYYKKSHNYIDRIMKENNYEFWDRYGNFWNNSFDYIEFYFLNRYLKNY